MMRITGKNIPIYTLFNLGKYSETFPGAYHQMQKPLLICFILLLLMILLRPGGLSAQDIRRTSLFGWEEVTKHMIKDRYHNFGGLFYDRGLYRFTTLEMTREHELDLISRDFTTVDDYNWFYEQNSGFRTFAGSYNLGEFLHGAVIRNQVPVTENLMLPLQFTRRYDFHTNRALIELGLEYNISGSHYTGISHTLTEQKPDLDATLFYRYGTINDGFIQFEFSPLDWANNASYELSERRGDPFPEIHKYEIRPYLLSVRATIPVFHNFRGEITGGIQTLKQSVADGIEGLEEPFRDREKTRYLGILLEYATPHFTTTISWQHRYASFSRTNTMADHEIPIYYGNFQTHKNLGVFLSFNYAGFYIDNWLWIKYNRDKQFDEYEERFRSGFQTYPFDFEEDRVQMRNRLGYDTNDRGFMAALEWSADYRNFKRGTVDHPSYGIVDAFDYRDYYIRQLSNRQERITFLFGYRFTQHTYIETGISYDIDGDVYRGAFDQAMNQNPSWFDGGFGRLVLYW